MNPGELVEDLQATLGQMNRSLREIAESNKQANQKLEKLIDLLQQMVDNKAT
jgi:hypothetical protein